MKLGALARGDREHPSTSGQSGDRHAVGVAGNGVVDLSNEGEVWAKAGEIVLMGGARASHPGNGDVGGRRGEVEGDRRRGVEGRAAAGEDALVLAARRSARRDLG